MRVKGRYEKNRRYRQKQISEGKCPHCGKPCAPYYECDKRRQYKKMLYSLNRLVIAGHIEQIGGKYRALDNSIPLKKMRVLEYNTKPDDKRIWPRIGRKYINIIEIVTAILEDAGQPLREQEIYDRLMNKITDMKRD